MTTKTTCRGIALCGLLLSLALSACGRKEQPPAADQASPGAPAAATTTTTTTTTTPPPPPAWRAARWGMSKEEVLAAFPGEAQRLAKAESYGQPVAGASDVAIPSYEADGAKFRVLFGFDSGVLDRIHLAAPKPAAGTCGDLEKQLTASHGAPASRSETGTSLRGDATVWSAPVATITLACFERPSLGFRLVTLDYVPPATVAAAP